MVCFFNFVVFIVFLWVLIDVFVILLENNKMNVVVILIIIDIINVLMEIGDEENEFGV